VLLLLLLHALIAIGRWRGVEGEPEDIEGKAMLRRISGLNA